MASEIPSAAGLGTRPDSMIQVGIAFLTLSWTAVILRVYVRAHMIHSFGWDDWTMILALLLFTAQCACLMVVASIETSDELHNVAKLGILAQIPTLRKLFRVIIVAMGLYLWATVVLKISLAIFFLRVITKQWHRNVIYTTTIVYSLYGIAFAFIGVFQCGNPANFLENQILGKCLSSDILQPMNYVSGGLNALTDWIYVFFPIHVVWRAQMPRAAKFSAGVLLGFAAVGSISSLIRIVYIPGLKNGPDFFSNAIDIANWSMIEPGIGIFTASLATLRPLFKRLRDVTNSMASASFGSSHNRRTKSTFGKGIPASGFSASDRGGDRQQLQDDETGITFNLAERPQHTGGKRRTELRELGYDLDKVVFMDERPVTESEPWPLSTPVHSPVPSDVSSPTASSIRPLVTSLRPTAPHNGEQHTHVNISDPNRAYIKDGKVVFQRSSDRFPHDSRR